MKLIMIISESTGPLKINICSSYNSEIILKFSIASLITLVTFLAIAIY